MTSPRERRATYHRAAMRRTGAAFLLTILVAALPTVASLCQLRCTAQQVATADKSPSPCAGHATGNEGKAPRSVRPADIAIVRGTSFLRRAMDTGIEIQIDRAIVGTIRPLGSFLVTPDQRLGRGTLASADLSPPLGRSTDILRL